MTSALPAVRRIVGSVALLALAGGLAACGPGQVDVPEVVVTGEPGGTPELQYEVPLEVTEPYVEVIWAGSGPRVVEGEPVLLDFYAESGEDGSVINETFSGEPKPYRLSVDTVGRDIFDALVGQTVGSRVLQLVPPAEGQSSSTVVVFDLLPTRATGEPVTPREGLPTVELAADGEPSITVPEGEPPAELVVQPLIRGAGPQVEPGQVITVQYTGVTWSDGEVFESSWDVGRLPASFPIGVSSVLPGWDRGLVEQTVGSQVLLIVPPALGYGGTDAEHAEDTLVFVVDILAASGGPTNGREG